MPQADTSTDIHICGVNKTDNKHNNARNNNGRTTPSHNYNYKPARRNYKGRSTNYKSKTRKPVASYANRLAARPHVRGLGALAQLLQKTSPRVSIFGDIPRARAYKNCHSRSALKAGNPMQTATDADSYMLRYGSIPLPSALERMLDTMAQTHAQNAAHDAPLPNGASPDQTAWLAECAAIKCRTDAGEVWAYSGGKLFTVPAPAGFAELPAASRRLFAMMAMQFLPTRVGQNASGNVSNEIAKAVADPSAYFSTKDKDAFEAAYGDHVSDLVDNVKGWNADAVKKMSDADKKARAVLIAKSIDKPSNREKFFESSVRAAIEAGRNVTGKEKKRQAKTSGDGGLDL